MIERAATVNALVALLRAVDLSIDALKALTTTLVAEIAVTPGARPPTVGRGFCRARQSTQCPGEVLEECL